jgi:putative MFS transporter
VIADRLGRKPGIVLLSLAWAASGVAYAYAGSNVALMGIGFVVILSSYALVAVGYAIYIPELFPTRVRLRGAGLAGAAGRLASAGAQYGVVWAYGYGGVEAVAACLAVMLVVQAGVVLVAGIETRQRSLEDLSGDFSDAPVGGGISAVREVS